MSQIDVSAICAVFGGGGHAKAAGASIAAGSLMEAAEAILREVAKHL
jgi:nanoRNase/pAp phosphatase (c-di-AMP/oligoRNAs hydrolase)